MNSDIVPMLANGFARLAVMFYMVLALGAGVCVLALILAFKPATKRLAFGLGCLLLAVGLILLALLVQKGSFDPEEILVIITPIAIGAFTMAMTWRSLRTTPPPDKPPP